MLSNKIALISPHNEPNYGTMLQAYALAKAIENIGFSAEYISYTKVVRENLLEKILYYSIQPIKIINWLKKRKKEKIHLMIILFFKHQSSKIP
jgi:hypothetical protein